MSKRPVPVCVSLTVVLAIVAGGSHHRIAARAPGALTTLPISSPDISRLPLIFEPNRGQASGDDSFIARGHGYLIGIRRGGARLSFEVAGVRRQLVMEPLDASAREVIEPVDPLPGRSHYFLGEVSERLVDIPHFSRLVAREIYSGIDLVYYGNGRSLEYDFVIAAGADPRRVRLRFAGQDSVALNADGDLIFRFGDHELRQPRPKIYQLPDHDVVEGAFVIHQDGAIGFALEHWDRTRPLVIDPTLVMATYVGGSGSDAANAVALDSSGNIFLVGTTASTNFPTQTALQDTLSGAKDAFVTRLNPSGTAILYSTYFGGGDEEEGRNIAVDAAGSAYVVGLTRSSNFPRSGQLSASCASSGSDGFIVKLNATGAISYSACVGSAFGSDDAFGVAVDAASNAYIVGETGGGLPIINATQPTFGGNVDGFLGSVNPGGSGWRYLTYVGGSGADTLRAVAVNAAFSVCIAGRTSSSNLPVQAAQQSTLAGLDDAIVAKYGANAARQFQTYLGGSGLDGATANAIDGAGNCYVVGTTSSSNFPLQSAAQPTSQGFGEGFVTAYNASGSGFIYSTYLGGVGTDEPLDLVVDSTGVAHLAGQTSSASFPTLQAFQNRIADPGTVFLSTNAATSFTQTALAALSVNAVAVDPTNGQIAYAATSNGIYKTTNGGGSWTRLETGLSYTQVTSIVVDPNAPCTIYAGFDTFLFNSNSNAILLRSTNCGDTWGIPAGTPLGERVSSLAMTTANPAVLYFSYNANTATVDTYQVGRTTSTGFQFSTVGLPAIVATDPANPCHAYYGEFSGRVYKNTNCSAFSWSQVGATLDGTISSLLVHPTNSVTVFAGTQNGTLYRKVDDGSPWGVVKTFSNASNVGVHGLIYKPGSATAMYAAAAGLVAVSSDGGASWTNGPFLGPTISKLAASPSAPDAIYASTFGGSDGFYTRLTATGAIAGSTYLGGHGVDQVRGLALDSDGSVVAVGSTAAFDFPVTPGVVGSTQRGGGDAFIARINPTAAPNTPPTISDVANQSIPIGGSTGALPFVVSDAETAPTSLTVGVASSNLALVPNSNLMLGGSGGNRTITVTAAAGQIGATTITLTVSDGALTTSDTFVVTVTSAPNTAPTISAVPDQTITQSTSTGPLNIAIGDAETAASALTLSASSSNLALVTAVGIALGGTGAARSVNVTPIPGQTGATTITLTVSDGTLTATTTFKVTVTATPVLRPPTSLAVVSIVGNVVTLSWTAPVNSIAPTGYVVEGGVTAGSVLGSLPTGSTATTFAFTAPTGAFYVRVHTLAGATRSAPSNEIRIFVNVPAPPDPPRNLVGTPVGSSLTLTWQNAPSGGPPDALLLDVTGTLNTSFTLPVTQSFSAPVVPPGTYTISLRATNRSGTSAPSNNITLTFPSGCTPPGPPTNLSATRSGNIVTVSWTAPLSGVTPTGYTVTVGGAFTGVFSTPGLRLSGAAGPGTYTLAVAATSGCGSGPPANTQITVP